MAFESLSERLTGAFKKLRSRGRLTEKDINEAMREVRMALLEADVNYKVARDFVKTVSARAVGADVLESLTPGQQVIKIVNEELIALMGGEGAKIQMASRPPTIVMLTGLQGAGKTTNGAKLAAYFKRQGKRPLMAACDVYRPAAITQLKIAAGSVEVPVYEEGQGDPVKIAQHAVEHARRHGNDIVFIDTAGRLHIDDELMDELRRIRDTVHPNEILFFANAMTGQDAVTAAGEFNDQIGIDGVFMTQMDSDARGGAALSIRAVTGKPIKFIGTGEKIADPNSLELFYPDRMASRILGMGDMLTLIEKAQQDFDEKKAEELEKKLRENKFDLNDYMDQLKQMKKMGSLRDIAGMLPGVKASQLDNMKLDDRQFVRMEAILTSMTPQERENPEIISHSRKKRIAAGCGQRVEDVNRLLKQFDMIQQMTKTLAKSGGQMPSFGPGGLPKMKRAKGRTLGGGNGKYKLPF